MHLEEVAAYDPSDPVAARGAAEFMGDTIIASRDQHLGFCFCGFSEVGHALLSEDTCNYRRWLAEIKRAFDPRDVSDGGYYISEGKREVAAGPFGLTEYEEK